ncbi:uncharacterized protein LOC109603618 [Aethina tumida]|uniref:uncharacterized protein LOC109603618 n=1 Tax=Aethina tumida TaxID=116153 RepID=UPI002147A523|nr:uncharacterized protein LOC109603618 [Aethina tumida]
MRLVCRYHFSCITAATWTIVQTLFRLAWTIFGYYAYSCSVELTTEIFVFVYLTYFYKKSCGEIHLEDQNIFVLKDLKPSGNNNSLNRINFLKVGDYSLYQILEEVLSKGIFPEEANAAYRTSVYIQIFIISDIVWITTAVLLIVGSLLAVKNCWTLIFNLPYMICTGIISIIDVIAAVHFGFDLLAIKSFTQWLKFIGVSNYQEFEHLNGSLGPLGPAIPTIILIQLSLRFFIFWIPNIYAFYGVMSTTVESFKNLAPSGRFVSGGGQSTVRARNKHYSSEARIRKWQEFYGASSAEASSDSISIINESDMNTKPRDSTPHCSRKKVVVTEPIEDRIVIRRTSGETSV